MMAHHGFLAGIMLGLSITAPIGPMAMLCIHRTLVHGAAAGIMTGLGAATVQLAYAAIVTLSLPVASLALAAHSPWLQCIGPAFLLLIAGRLVVGRPHLLAGRAERGVSLIRCYASAVGLNAVNPVLLALLFAVFASLRGISGFMPTMLLSGIFAGSVVWWIGLSCGIGWIRGRLKPMALMWCNRISGLALAGLGGALLARALLSIVWIG